MELIPFVGPVLGALPPILVALFQDPLTGAVGRAAVRRAAADRGPHRRPADLRPHAAHQPAAGDLRAAGRRRDLRDHRGAGGAADRGDRARDGRLPAPPPGARAVGDDRPAGHGRGPGARSGVRHGARTRATRSAARAARRSVLRSARDHGHPRRRAASPSASASAWRCATSRSRPAPGERLAIIGPNGAGKTTLLSILAGHPGARRRARDAPARGRRLGPAAAGGLRQALGAREPAAVRPAGEVSPTSDATVDRMLELTGAGRARRRRGRQALAAATASGSTSPSACWPSPTCCCSTSRRPRWTRASASCCGSSSAGWRRAARRSSSRPTTSARPSATPTASSCSPTASCSSTARRGEPGRRAARLRGGVRQLPARAGPLMRWLALKDLQILRRSPLLLVRCWSPTRSLLGLVVGLRAAAGRPSRASRSSTRSRRARADVPARQRERRRQQVRRPAVRVDRPGAGRARATRRIAKVRSGDALGALIVPADIPQQAPGDDQPHGRRPPPVVEFYYQGDNPLKSRYVQSAMKSRIADANRALSQKITGVAGEVPRLHPPRRRSSRCSGQSFDVLGLENAERIVQAVESDAAGAQRRPRRRSSASRSFAQLAADNLDLSERAAGDDRPADPGQRARARRRLKGSD